MDQTKFDDCNALILTKKKNSATLEKSKLNNKVEKHKNAILSNKKRKVLQKILERKSKKLNVSFKILNSCF